MQPDLHTYSCCSCVTIFLSKKAKTSIYNQLNIPAAIIVTSAIKKAKMAKDILNKKFTTAITPATGTTALALQFLQIEN